MLSSETSGGQEKTPRAAMPTEGLLAGLAVSPQLPGPVGRLIVRSAHCYYIVYAKN